MIRLLFLLLIGFAAPALCAQEYDFDAASDAADEDPAEPVFTKPWGLWANRAPYPYYNGAFSMDSDDDLVARDIFFDFQTELWLTPSRYRGAWFQMRARMGIFFLDASFLQVARHDANTYLGKRLIKDWSFVTDARGHLGLTVPLPHLGYIDLGIGVAGYDETTGPSTVAPDFRASVSLYPLWPLGFEGHVSRAQFLRGGGITEWGVRLYVQVFRHLFISTGWRWRVVDGSDFNAHGFTIGFSFKFSNLRTFFWDPMRGPAW